MAFLAGNKGKVTLGASTVVGMGSWKLNGITVDQLESTSFGDTAKQYMTGLLYYGTVEFAGLYDPADTTGQGILVSAMLNNSKIANIRLYVVTLLTLPPRCMKLLKLVFLYPHRIFRSYHLVILLTKNLGLFISNTVVVRI